MQRYSKCNNNLDTYKCLCSRPVPVPPLPAYHSKKEFSNFNSNKLKFSDGVTNEKNEKHKESLVTSQNPTNWDDRHLEWPTKEPIGL